MAYEYESKEVRALRSIDSKTYNRDLTQNLIGLNNATDYMAQYMISMQKGIDDANKDIIQKIQDFINDIIIIFSGGEDTGFDFGDLKYILQAIGAMFGFGDGIVDAVDAAEHFFSAFLQPLAPVIDFVNGLIQAVFEFFADLLSNVPVIGSTLSEIVTNAATGINATTATADQAIIVSAAANSNVQVVLDGLPLQPYWATMNIAEECSFPRVLLMYMLYDGQPTGATLNTNWWKLTASADGGGGYSRFFPVYTPAANTLEGAFIRSMYPGGRALITYMVDAVTSPCELYIVLCRMQADGDVEIAWVSANQTPLITNSRFERTVQAPTDIMFQIGESMFAAIHQRGSGNVRPLIGIQAADIPNAAGIYPPQIKAVFSSSSVLTVGQVIAAGSLVFTNKFIPFISVGKILSSTPPKLSFYDPFDSALSSSWARLSSTVATTSSGVFVVSGTTDGIRIYLYAQALNYDDGVVYGNAVNANARYQRLFGRYSPDGLGGVALTINSLGVWLDKVVNGTTFINLYAWNFAVSNNENWALKFVGNVYTAQKWNGAAWVDIFSYTDVPNAISTGIGHRNVGVSVERFSFGNSGGWQDWGARDY